VALLNLQHLACQQVRELLATVGIPYRWGAGEPSTPWPAPGYDCSGFAQGALVRLGLLHPSHPDRRAVDLANLCDPVDSGQERLGDLAFYGSPVSHVMVVLAPGLVIGARGGGSRTHGGDPRACVGVRVLTYRSLTVVGRPREALRRAA